MSASNNPYRVERTSRQVIERKLLTALDEQEDVVALLVTEWDLECLCQSLEKFNTSKSVELAKGLRQLQKEAFGES